MNAEACAPAIVLGDGAGEHVSVLVTRREFPELFDYWDGNWVYATVRIRLGAFRGEYEALLRATSSCRSEPNSATCTPR